MPITQLFNPSRQHTESRANPPAEALAPAISPRDAQRVLNVLNSAQMLDTAVTALNVIDLMGGAQGECAKKALADMNRVANGGPMLGGES